MKYRYKFHPYDYALGENEKFYSDMEAKGWRLVKRGGYLSKFIRTEPGSARYRIEAVSGGVMEDGCTMPLEQRAVYEDCGWEYVTGYNLLHIFRAPEGSGAPEFYADPAEQAAALKSLRQQAMLAWIPLAVILALNLVFGRYLGEPRRNLSLWYIDFVQQTAAIAVCILVILQALFSMFLNLWRINRTCRRLKKGIPLDHNPRGHFVPKSVSRAVLCAVGLGIVLAVFQWFGTKSLDLPSEADGPYLLLRDLGYDLERRPPFNSPDRESGITHTSSLMADYWDVYETVGDQQTNVWMFQDIYRLRSPKMAKSLVNALRNTAAFGGGNAEDCTGYVRKDMMAWIYKDIEIIAVSGNMAAHITWAGGAQPETDPGPLLDALQARWREFGIVTDGKTEEQWYGWTE